MTYEQRKEEARGMSTPELLRAAQGCIEETCLYHGPFNAILHERGEW